MGYAKVHAIYCSVIILVTMEHDVIIKNTFYTALYNLQSQEVSMYHLSKLSVNAILSRVYCRGVIIPTPLVVFSGRSLYRARIAFLRGAMAISKIDGHFFYFFT